MQIREQWKGSRNWKLVTGAATAATLSLGAFTIAIPGGADEDPPSIALHERAAVDAEPTAGGFVPFDLGRFTGLHVPNELVHDDPRFEGGPFWGTRPFSADSRPGQAGFEAPPVTDGTAEVLSDGVAASDDAEEATSVDVLSDEGADATADATDDGGSDDVGTDGPAVPVGDDPLTDDSVSNDSPDLVPDDVPPIVDESFDSVSNDSFDSISLDSPDDSD